MDHLDAVSLADLQRALDEVEGKRPTQRLVAAIAYKRGVSQTELATWFDVQRRTIYNWLTRFDGGSLVDAARDERRPGRPRKLDDEQQKKLECALSEPPGAVGFDEPEWTPALVRRYVRTAFDVEYSSAHCRRLLEAAGG